MSRVYNKRNNLIAQVASNGYRYLESSNYCSLLVPQLDQLFDAKFIHLHRDGRSFIKSGLRKGWYGELDQHGQYPPMRARSLLRRRLLIDIGNPGYDHRLVPPKRLSSRVEKLAWLWAEYNGAILRDLAPLPPERKLTIRLDEFGMSTFGKLHAFMDLDVESSTLEQMVQMAESKPNRGTPFSVKWSAHDERAFLSLGGQMAETLGY